MSDRENVMRRIADLIAEAEAEDVVMLPAYETLKVLKAALELLKGQTTSGWVSVKDRMPEVGEKCLIRDKTDVTTARLTDKEHQIWRWEDSDFYGRGGITHWMPIPPGPEDDK